MDCHLMRITKFNWRNIKLTFIPLIPNNDKKCNTTTERVNRNHKWTNDVDYFTAALFHHILICACVCPISAMSQDQEAAQSNQGQ